MIFPGGYVIVDYCLLHTHVFGTSLSLFCTIKDLKKKYKMEMFFGLLNKLYMANIQSHVLNLISCDAIYIN